MDTADLPHKSVLRKEVVELVAPRPGGRYLDATLGAGGHAEAVLEASGPDGWLLGIDQDPVALAFAAKRLERFGERVCFHHGNFRELGEVARLHGPFDALVADLGVSSLQLDDPARGFAFSDEGPLDMRMDPGHPETARALLNRLDERSIAKILREYGEERLSRPIARGIVRAREQGRLESTGDLAEIARACYRRARIRERIDPATRSFQALRIAVNRELEAAEDLLDAAEGALAPGGVAAIIAFHSLEDRLVKHRFRAWATGCICPPDLPVCGCGREPRAELLTRRPLRPSEAEMSENPRARSARLRGARWIATADSPPTGDART